MSWVHKEIWRKFLSERIPTKKKTIHDIVKKAENSVVIEPVRRHISGTQYKLVESNIDH